MVDASAEDYADLLGRVYSGEGRLATALSIPGDDPEATRAEALAIGRWAQEFASTLRGAAATSSSGTVPYSPASSDRRRAISASLSAAACWRRVVRVPTTGGSPGPPCNW